MVRLFQKIAIFAMVCPCVLAAEIVLQGRVVSPNADPIAAARLRATANSTPIAATADPQGRFSISLPIPAEYTIVLERDGYYPLQNPPRRPATHPRKSPSPSSLFANCANLSM